MISTIESMTIKAKEIAKLIETEDGKIHIVTHHDADGISSGTIIYKTLEILGKDITIDVVRQLEDEIVKNISKPSVAVSVQRADGIIEKNIKLRLPLAGSYDVNEQRHEILAMIRKLQPEAQHLFLLRKTSAGSARLILKRSRC